MNLLSRLLNRGSSLEERLDELADEHQMDNPPYPELIFAGDPPAYPEWWPYDKTYVEEDTIDGHLIATYRPRIWDVTDDKTFTLHDMCEDPDVDVDNPEEREFALEIEPTDYVAYRLVNPMWHDDAPHLVPEVYP